MRRHDGRRRGWFKLPGRQDGDRAVEDQLKGLRQALFEVRQAAIAGYPLSVLDLGCAEGAIALEFAKAGAKRVVGVDVVPGHVAVARDLCAGYPCEFHCADLNGATALLDAVTYDVVLMLAIIHKLRRPSESLSWYSDFARDLLVFRMPAFWEGSPDMPTSFRSERYGQELVDVAKVLAARRFHLERVERGPTSERGHEPVLYFRRAR